MNSRWSWSRWVIGLVGASSIVIYQLMLRFFVLTWWSYGQSISLTTLYWGDDVTIYQLVITTSFHFSLLSLIARHITIVTPEPTIQSYQYITTVTLFTRTQSSTLGPRWLEYNNIFFIPTFTVALLLHYRYCLLNSGHCISSDSSDKYLFSLY